MPTVRVNVNINGQYHEASVGERLSDLLMRCGYATEHPCGGRGTCQKCTVTVDGQAVLSCRYVIRGDVTVSLSAPDAIRTVVHADGETETSESIPAEDAETVLALDLGTTTLALARVDSADGRLLRVATANNPQRAFGADVMSRIAAVREHGVHPLAEAVREAIRRLMDELGTTQADRLYVAGNTTMLHLLLGIDPTSMGTAPYTPVFLDRQTRSGVLCGLPDVGEVIALPGISAFVGADLVAGLCMVGLPEGHAYRLLVDLGTNAEILLFDRERILCTAAAAGPCFEGASVSCGMSATAGAICAYEPDGTWRTVEDAPPRGLCGSGLVDAVAALLKTEVVDETGYMSPPRFYLAEGVSLTREDIRQYQLAKSAVRAAIETLLRHAGIDYAAVEHMYIAGGFAATVNVENAVYTGLLPEALAGRCTPVGNSSLLGAARYAADQVDPSAYTERARYVDLAADPYFAERFMEGMMFS